MSKGRQFKGRQFQDLSTGMFRLTIPTWTIKLQSQTATQVMNRQVLIEVAKLSCTSLVMCSQPQSSWQCRGNSQSYQLFFIHL